jgi:hypothetical protein
MAINPSPAARFARATLSRKERRLTPRSWDKKIERDSKKGKFASLIKKARAEHRKGKSKVL